MKLQRTVGIFLLLETSSIVLAQFDNFYEQHRGGYDFIFHSNTNLLLIVHDHHCYYTAIPNERKPYLDNPFYRNLMEDELVKVVQLGGRGLGDLRTSSPTEVLNAFQDRLADFRCSQKDISLIQLSDAFYSHIIQLVDTTVG